MGDFKGVVNKPQFDMDIFKPGVPVILRAQRGIDGCFRTKKANALVLKAYPLQVVFCIVSKDLNDDYESKNVNVLIEQIIDGTYEISFLKEDN